MNKHINNIQEGEYLEMTIRHLVMEETHHDLTTKLPPIKEMIN